VNDDELTIATSSADSTVRLWKFNPEKQNEKNKKKNIIIDSFQVFDLANSICFCVKLCLLPKAGGLLLAYGN
jgi:WD40 repeat protein